MNTIKKITFTVIGLFVMTTAMNAQKWSFDNKRDYQEDWFGIDLGVGGMKDLNGTGVDFGLRYLHSYSRYIAWNAVNLKAIANTKDFSKSITPQIMTGIRLTSPNFLQDLSAFGGFKAGYGYNIDGKDGGFCYEVEAGVNVTRNLFVGFAYNNQKLDGLQLKYSAFRIGFNI